MSASPKLQRPTPYVWVTWITKLLAGETHCTWSVWLRANYKTAPMPSDFDSASWKIGHTALLRKTIGEMTTDGFFCSTEDQNSFTMMGNVGTLAGKPDLIASSEKGYWIVDVKTGQPRVSDKVQVMIYMWAIPLVRTKFKGKKFDGKVQYANNFQIIMADEVDRTFIKNVGELMKEVCSDKPPSSVPSFAECRYCPITPEDCSERVEVEDKYVGETDEF